MPEIRIRLAGSVQEIIDLRHVILRKGLPRDTARFDGDDEPQTRHLVAETTTESGDRIIGCASLFRRPWNGAAAHQLRGMAVADGCQRLGIGSKLLAEIERLARAEGFSLQLWCNARTSATQFYRKHGWAIASDEFVIPNAGPHIRMTKSLT